MTFPGAVPVKPVRPVARRAPSWPASRAVLPTKRRASSHFWRLRPATADRPRLTREKVSILWRDQSVLERHLHRAGTGTGRCCSSSYELPIHAASLFATISPLALAVANHSEHTGSAFTDLAWYCLPPISPSGL